MYNKNNFKTYNLQCPQLQLTRGAPVKTHEKIHLVDHFLNVNKI